MSALQACAEISKGFKAFLDCPPSELREAARLTKEFCEDNPPPGMCKPYMDFLVKWLEYTADYMEQTL